MRINVLIAALLAVSAVVTAAEKTIFTHEMKGRGAAAGIKQANGTAVQVFDYDSPLRPQDCVTDAYECRPYTYQGKRCLRADCVNSQGKQYGEDPRKIFCNNST